MIAQVSYYKIQAANQPELFRQKSAETITTYEEQFWTIVITGLQTEIGKSRRLLSASAYDALHTLYTDLIKLDHERGKLI